jgi:hypothetical protein
MPLPAKPTNGSLAQAESAPPAAPAQPTAQRSAEVADAVFQQGLADRTTWETWDAGLSGDFKEGADWWSANRSVKGHAPCEGQPRQPEWVRGCVTAKAKMDFWDEKRKSDLHYRRGWNSYHGKRVIAASAAPAATSQSQPPQATAPTPIVPITTTQVAVAAPATEPKRDPDVFGDDQLRDIVYAAQNNEVHFDRAFKGKRFAADGIFDSAQKALFSNHEYILRVLTRSGSVNCATSESALLDQTEKWGKGHPVRVTGEINDTIIGELKLANGCRVVSR